MGNTPSKETIMKLMDEQKTNQLVTELRKRGGKASFDEYFDVSKCKMYCQSHAYDQINWIHYAAAYCTGEIVNSVIQVGGNVNSTTKKCGFTPLMFAAIHNNYKTIMQLCGLSCDPDAKDRTQWGRTALHWAADLGHFEAVEELVKYKADIHVKDKKGKLPIDLAEGQIKEYLLKLSKSEEPATKSELQQLEQNMEKKMDEKIMAMINRTAASEGHVMNSTPRNKLSSSRLSRNDSMLAYDRSNPNGPSLANNRNSSTASTGERASQREHVASRHSLSDGQEADNEIAEVFQNDAKPEVNLMCDEHRQQLRSNFADLVKIMQPINVIRELFSSCIINENDYEYLTSPGTLNTEKCSYILIRLIMQGTEEQFKQFLQALENTGQGNLAEIIRKTEIKVQPLSDKKNGEKLEKVTKTMGRSKSVENVGKLGIYLAEVEESIDD